MKTLLWILVGLSFGAAAIAADWTLIAGAKGTNYDLANSADGAFTVKITGNESGTAAVQGCLTLDRVVALPAKIQFRARLAGKDKIQLSPVLSTKVDGKAPAVYGPAAELKGGEWKSFELSLVKDFKLTGDKAQLWQFKLGVKLPVAAGETATLEIKDFAVTEGEADAPAKVAMPVAPADRWTLIAPADGASYEIISGNAETFAVKLKRNAADAPARVQSCININQNVHSQNKLAFSYRLSGDKPVVMQPLLSYLDNGKTVMGFGPKINVIERDYKEMVLPLDGTFRLADAPYFIHQLKFSFDISGSPDGTLTGVEVKNIRLVSSSDLSSAAGEIKVKIMPPPAIAQKVNPGAVKIYFSFDNEDFATVFEGRGRYPKTPDHFQYPGFRDMLLETVREQTMLAPGVADADVIVYSRTRPDSAEAQMIAAKVKAGTPLIAFAAVPDPEIAALLPVTVQALAANGIPARQPLQPASPQDPLFAGLNPAAFGRYNQLTVQAGAAVRLRYADGTPAVVGKNKILYSALTVGADLIPGKAAHDPFLLRAVAELTGKAISEKDVAQPLTDDGYMAGAGDQNFGRFGFLIGDGLLTENMSNTLGVTNGSQEYAFSSQTSPKIPFEKWSFQYLTGPAPGNERIIDWFYQWPDVGTVELAANCQIPADWQNQSVYFSAPAGIDDTAEVFFNNVSIGKVTADMPNYWMRPHKYLIKPELIKFGQSNQVRIVSENLRGAGGFGACPELLTASETNPEPWQLVIDRINWIGKGGVITEPGNSKRRFDTSLAFPGIRWEFFGNHIDMALYHLAEYAAYVKDGKIVTVNLSQTDAVPTDWSEPWLLLYRAGSTRPLLLVFHRRPESVAVKRSGNTINGIAIDNSQTVGVITPVWLSGRVNVDCSDWSKTLPAATLKNIDFWTARAFAYPAGASESFKIDEGNKRVLIKTAYQYLTAANDWGKTPIKMAPVSPLAYFTKGLLFASDEVVDMGLVTSYGNYAARDNADTVHWSLPLPEEDLSVTPEVNIFPEYKKRLNELFRESIRYSAGGGVKQSDWTSAYPTSNQLPNCLNYSMHAALFGIPQVLTAPFELDQTSKAAFDQRLNERLYQPVEQYQFKCATRWREEPYSKIRYSVYFNSRHPIHLDFADNFGSLIDYGDQNETIFMLLGTMQMLADRAGQRDLVLANGKFIRQVVKLGLVSDDWGYMACHCRESGLSATIDMLNCEYGTMMKLARLANILGDKALHQQALYRAARRTVPAVARFYFKDYAVKNGLLLYPESVSFCTGFTEDGIHFRNKGATPQDIDLYDMSQGIPVDLVKLYQTYVKDRQETYFTGTVYPAMFDKDGKYLLDMILLNIIARGSALDRTKIEKALQSYMANQVLSGYTGKLSDLSKDWPGMVVLSYYSGVIDQLYGKVIIKSAKDVNILSAVYDPAQKTFAVEFIPGGGEPEILLQSELAPVADPQIWEADNGQIKLKIRGRERRSATVRFE